MSSHRLFRFPKPQWLNSATARVAGVYLAGALVSLRNNTLVILTPYILLTIIYFIFMLILGWKPYSKEAEEASNTFTYQFSVGFFSFIDAAAFSKSARNGSDYHVNFVDWIPGICSALGMLVINSIDKNRLAADSFSYSGNGVAWKARLVLFLGFALMAGGLAGSVTVLVLKYVVPGAVFPTLWLGVANVVANAMIMTRYASVIYWRAYGEDDWANFQLQQLRRTMGGAEYGGRVYLQSGVVNVEEYAVEMLPLGSHGYGQEDEDWYA